MGLMDHLKKAAESAAGMMENVKNAVASHIPGGCGKISFGDYMDCTVYISDAKDALLLIPKEAGLIAEIGFDKNNNAVERISIKDDISFFCFPEETASVFIKLRNDKAFIVTSPSPDNSVGKTLMAIPQNALLTALAKMVPTISKSTLKEVNRRLEQAGQEPIERDTIADSPAQNALLLKYIAEKEAAIEAERREREKAARIEAEREERLAAYRAKRGVGEESDETKTYAERREEQIERERQEEEAHRARRNAAQRCLRCANRMSCRQVIIDCGAFVPERR